MDGLCKMKWLLVLIGSFGIQFLSIGSLSAEQLVVPLDGMSQDTQWDAAGLEKKILEYQSQIDDISRIKNSMKGNYSFYSDEFQFQLSLDASQSAVQDKLDYYLTIKSKIDERNSLNRKSLELAVDGNPSESSKLRYQVLQLDSEIAGIVNSDPSIAEVLRAGNGATVVQGTGTSSSSRAQDLGALEAVSQQFVSAAESPSALISPNLSVDQTLEARSLDEVYNPWAERTTLESFGQGTPNPYLKKAESTIAGYASNGGDGNIFTNKRQETQNAWRKDIDRLTQEIELARDYGASTSDINSLRQERDALISAGLQQGFSLRSNQGGDPFVCTGTKAKCPDAKLALVPKIASELGADLLELQSLYNQAKEIEKSNDTSREAEYKNLLDQIKSQQEKIETGKNSLAQIQSRLAAGSLAGVADQRKILNTQNLIAGIADKVDEAILAIQNQYPSTTNSIVGALQAGSFGELAKNYAFFGVQVHTDENSALSPVQMAQNGTELDHSAETGFELKNVGLNGDRDVQCNGNSCTTADFFNR